jgi:putative peptidoglycan lipid II flippase
MAPLVFAGLFYRAATVIERMIASTLPMGSISYLGYANRITAILGTIATAGISTTIFPIMARGWAENDFAKVREYFAKGVRIIMLTTFPIAMVFVVLRVPIIQVVFERGAFDHKATIAVANVLAILMVVFITGGLGNVVGKGFYISQKTKLVTVLGIIEILAYIGAAYFLTKAFSYIGLAIASSIQFVFGLTASMYCMKKIYNGINGKKVINGFVKIIIASFISGGFIYCSFHVATLINMSLILKTGIAGFLGLITFALVSLYVFRLEEVISMQQKLIERFRVSIISH